MKKCLFKRIFLSLITFLLAISFPNSKAEAYDPNQILNYISDLNCIHDKYTNFKTKHVIDEIIFALIDLFGSARSTYLEFRSLGDDAHCFIVSRIYSKFKHFTKYKKFLNFDKFLINKEEVEPIINLGKDKDGKYWIIVKDKETDGLSFVCV